MKVAAIGADRRAFGRRPTFQHAVVHAAGRAPLRCIVLDISEGGALLEFGDVVSLPSRVRLIWEGSREEARCEVRHTRGNRAGVQFVCEAGPHIARQSITLTENASKPLEAAPQRQGYNETTQPGAATDLVQRFRESIWSAKSAHSTLATIVPAVEARDTELSAAGLTDVITFADLETPLPLPACQYAEAIPSAFELCAVLQLLQSSESA